MAIRLGLLGDLHLVDDPTAATGAWHNPYDFAGVPDRLDLALERFAAEGVDAVVLLGDLCHHGSRRALARLGERLRAVSLPIVAVAGNHDVGGRPILEEVLGDAVAIADPAGTTVAGVHVAGVHVASGDWFAARLDAPPAVDAWPDAPVVLLSHYPLLSHAVRLAERGLPYPGDVLGRPEVEAALSARTQPTIVLSGHIHARDASTVGPVVQLTQGALVEPPYECSIVEIETGDPVAVRRTAVLASGPAPIGAVPAIADPETHHAFDGDRWAAGAPIAV